MVWRFSYLSPDTNISSHSILWRSSPYPSPCKILPHLKWHLDRRGIDFVLQRCLTHEEAEQVLNDCHSGECGGHLSGMAAAQNILHAGYFWPSVFKDCHEPVKKFPPSQHLYPKKCTHPALLHPIIVVGPFSKQRIYLMHSKPTSAKGHGYVIVVVDYFMKWT